MVRFGPPPQEVLRAGAYQIAVADCEANGGRWVVELDAELDRRASPPATGPHATCGRLFCRGSPIAASHSCA